RLAAIGIALVHRDAAEVVLEFFHRVNHRGRPVADARIETAAGSNQQREAGADLLVADANFTLFIERHGSLLRCCGRRVVAARRGAWQPFYANRAGLRKRFAASPSPFDPVYQKSAGLPVAAALDEGHPRPSRTG